MLPAQVKHAWHKRRWRCPLRACGAGTVTEQDPAIAPPREKLTTRAGRWATRQAGRARPVGEVAAELGCSWHRVNASERCWGSALLDADTGRISETDGTAARLRVRGSAGLMPHLGHPHRLHRARFALGEPLHRVLQRTPARRMPQHRRLRRPPRSPSRARGLENRIQHLPASPIPRRSHPRRLR